MEPISPGNKPIGDFCPSTLKLWPPHGTLDQCQLILGDFLNWNCVRLVGEGFVDSFLENPVDYSGPSWLD